MPKTVKKTWAMETRFVTKRAREAADEATDFLDESEPMTKFIDVWLAAYRAAGGIEKIPGKNGS